VHGPNFIKLGQDIELSSQHCTFVSDFGYLAAFSNAGGSKLSDVFDAKFCTFQPTVKIQGGVGKISMLNAEALHTIKPPKHI